MAQRQQFYQPQKRSSSERSGGVYDDESSSAMPTTVNARSAAASSGAEKTLSNLDEVLGANATHGKGSDEKSLSPGSIKKSEESGGLAHLGPEGAKETLVKGALGPEGAVAAKGIGKVKEALWGNKDKRNRTLMGGGAAGAIVTVFVLLFVAILPQKISLMIEHLQNRFFATTTSALNEETKNMFDSYLRNHVFPGLGKTCPSTKAEKSCAVAITGKGPVSRRFIQWKQINLEGKLANKYGIEFERVGVGSLSKIYIRAGTAAPEEIQWAYRNDRNPSIFTQISNPAARQAVEEALANETRFKQVFLRFQLRGIMDKYGIRRCIIACNLKDTWKDTVIDKKRAAVIFLAERVLQPHFAGLSIAMQCLIDTNCNPQNVTAGSGENGAPTSDYERQLQAEMDGFAAKFGEDSLKTILTSVNDILEKGFAKFFVESIVSGGADLAGKLTGKELASKSAGELAGKAVPFIGWANMAAEVISGLKNLGPKIRKMEYVTNAIGYVGMWTTYRTVVDESKSGHVDPTELGSFASSLSASSKGPGAETTPLYKNLFNNTTSNGATALLQTFLPQKAYAASAIDSQKYLNYCDGNDPDNPDPTADVKKPVPNGKLICSEESLVAGSTTTSNISNAIPGSLASLAGFWNSSLGKLFNVLGDIFGSLPGIQQVGGWVIQIIAPLVQLVIQYLIPNPFHSNQSGARNFVGATGGGDILGNETAHNQLGGQQLTNKQTATIVNEQINQDKQRFNGQSFFARLFDKNSEYSLVGQIALAMPSSIQDTAQASFANLLSDPFGKLLHGFSTLFTSNHAFAAVQPSDDPFGITQYGYPAGTIPADPESYWDANCADGTKTTNWNNAAAGNLNPLTEMPENNTTDPCLLIQAGASSAGQLF